MAIDMFRPLIWTLCTKITPKYPKCVFFFGILIYFLHLVIVARNMLHTKYNTLFPFHWKNGYTKTTILQVYCLSCFWISSNKGRQNERNTRLHGVTSRKKVYSWQLNYSFHKRQWISLPAERQLRPQGQ